MYKLCLMARHCDKINVSKKDWESDKRSSYLPSPKSRLLCLYQFAFCIVSEKQVCIHSAPNFSSLTTEIFNPWALHN